MGLLKKSLKNALAPSTFPNKPPYELEICLSRDFAPLDKIPASANI